MILFHIFIFFKIVRVFNIIIKNFISSLIWPQNLLTYKRNWALEVLKLIGYETSVLGAPPRSDISFICLGNHISFLDILLIMSSHPEICFLAKSDVKRWPIIGAGATRAGTLYVDRTNKTQRSQVRAQIGSYLKNKVTHLAIFPSGTTSLDENVNWKKGSFEIAHEQNISVFLFKVSYSPLRESAYIGQDNLIATLANMFKIKNKTAHLCWLGEYQITNVDDDIKKLKSIINEKEV